MEGWRHENDGCPPRCKVTVGREAELSRDDMKGIAVVVVM